LKQNKDSLRRVSATSFTVLHHLTRSLSRAETILTRILDSAGTPWVLIAETHGLTHQAI
jgi:hypothetical protein